MTKLIEFTDDYKVSGSLASLKKSALDKFAEWQKEFKGKKPTIRSVQRTEFGLFVVYEI